MAAHDRTSEHDANPALNLLTGTHVDRLIEVVANNNRLMVQAAEERRLQREMNRMQLEVLREIRDATQGFKALHEDVVSLRDTLVRQNTNGTGHTIDE
jgi:hypothetical protein